jgi:glycosyltransferase involved in cell wall biosynthesis
MEGAGPAGATVPAISVVIPARNECALIGRCLKAVLGQEFPRPYEVIVVDNASVDSTASIARTFGCRLIEEPTPGQLLAKHRGVQAAAAQIVAVLDADCVPPAHWLSTIYDAMSVRSGTIVAVTGRYRYEQGMPLWGSLYVAAMQVFHIGTLRLFRRSMPFVIGGNVAFRRESYELCGGYPQTGGLIQTETGLARNLNKRGVVKYVGAMEVKSSPRRFQGGVTRFFLQYKLLEYFGAGASPMSR